jgi:hypothetical protein
MLIGNVKVDFECSIVFSKLFILRTLFDHIIKLDCELSKESPIK